MVDRPELHVDSIDLLRELVRAGVDLIIVGAHALAAHGIPRATRDLDIFIATSPENARRTFDALARFGAPLAAHGISPADFEATGFVYQIGLPPYRIDLITSIDGVTFENARQTRLWVEMSGMAVPVIGREALIRNKRAAGRPKDIVDVQMLEGRRRRGRP